uniref:Uncharacterized protein n=1 Tax=Anopheles atroparvus TaxID=41427 RepID=A0AAG5DNG8_ANOAO
MGSSGSDQVASGGLGAAPDGSGQFASVRRRAKRVVTATGKSIPISRPCSLPARM